MQLRMRIGVHRHMQVVPLANTLVVKRQPPAPDFPGARAGSSEPFLSDFESTLAQLLEVFLAGLGASSEKP